MQGRKQELWIGGGGVPASDYFEVVDPAVGEAISHVADGKAQDGLAAVDAAADASSAWAERSHRDRAEILRRAFDLMIEERAEIARTIVTENGKSWTDAVQEVAYGAEFFRWFSEEACRVRGDYRRAPSGDKTIITDHRPVGLSLLITPWNFPVAMATRKLAPALAAGCTTVLKPAAETPLSAYLIADILARAGVPDGVVNVISTTRADEVVSEILRDPRVRKLSFTGSTEVGRHLLKKCADRIVSTSMELGGNAPFLVLEGSDVDAAVAAASIAKLRNGGASCIAANRFYVHESLAEEFAERLGTSLSELRVGPGLEPTNTLGAMVSIREREKIMSLTSLAEEDGADVRIGANVVPSTGAFMPPVVIAGVRHGDRITEHEIFGPVAPIIAVESLDEAVRAANDTPFGLISYVFARDPGTALGVARRLDSGVVAINRGMVSDPAAPFGGFKESGIGREGGFLGIHEFLEPQYVAADFGR